MCSLHQFQSSIRSAAQFLNPTVSYKKLLLFGNENIVNTVFLVLLSRANVVRKIHRPSITAQNFCSGSLLLINQTLLDDVSDAMRSFSSCNRIAISCRKWGAMLPDKLRTLGVYSLEATESTRIHSYDSPRRVALTQKERNSFSSKFEDT